MKISDNIIFISNTYKLPDIIRQFFEEHGSFELEQNEEVFCYAPLDSDKGYFYRGTFLKYVKCKHQHNCIPCKGKVIIKGYKPRCYTYDNIRYVFPVNSSIINYIRLLEALGEI